MGLYNTFSVCHPALLLLVVAFSAALCAAQSAHSIDASAIPGDVTVPAGDFTALTITAISGKRVTVPSGVTADSLTFSGVVTNGALEIKGGTFGSVTVGAITGGSVAFTGGTVNGPVTFSTLADFTSVNVGGLTVVGGTVTFGKIDGGATKPTVTLAGISLTHSVGGTYGVNFNHDVTSLGELSFKNTNIAVTGTSGVYAMNFARKVEDVGEVVFDGATITSACSGKTAASIYGRSAMTIGRVSVVGASITSTATASAYSLYLSGAHSNTTFLISGSAISAEATTGTGAYAATFGAMTGSVSGLDVYDSKVTATSYGATAQALCGGAVAGGFISVRRTLVAAVSQNGGAVSAGAFAAVAGLSVFRWTESPVSAVGKYANVYAVFAASMADVEEVYVEQQPIAAQSEAAGTAYAASFGLLLRVTSVTIRDVTITASAVLDAGAVQVPGATTSVGAILFKNVTASARASARAYTLYFGSAVSQVGSFVAEDVNLRATAFGTGSSNGFGAHSLVFYSTLDTIGAFTVRRAHLQADANRAYSTYGARSMYVAKTVSHVGPIVVENVTARAWTKQSLASAVHFAGAFSNVSSILVAEVEADARADASTAHAVSFGVLTDVREVVVVDSTVVAVAMSTCYAVHMTAMTGGRKLHLLRSTAISRTAKSSAHAMNTGALTRVDSLVVADATASATAGTTNAHAVSFAAVADTVEMTVHRVNATAAAGSATAHAIAGSSLTRVYTLAVQNVTADATAGSTTAKAVVFSGVLRHVGSLLFVNVTAGAHTTASGASSMCLPGSMEHSGAVVLREVRAEAFGRTGSASVMELGKWTNMTSLLVQDSVLRATGEGGSLKALAFGSSITGLGFVNVTDSTIEADSSMATTLASDSHALFFAGILEDVGAVNVSRCDVKSVAGSGAHAFIFIRTRRVGHITARHSTILAQSTTRSAEAIHIEASSDMASLSIVQCTVIAEAATTTAYAIVAGALTDVTVVEISDSTVRANAGGSTAHAASITSYTNGDRYYVLRSSISATSARAAYASHTPTLNNVKTVTVMECNVSARTTTADGAHASNFGALSGTDVHMVRSHVSAYAATFTAAAVVLTSLSSATTFGVETCNITAVARGSTARALYCSGTVTNVVDFIVQRSKALAIAETGSDAHALSIAGAVSSVATLYFVNTEVTAHAASYRARAAHIASIDRVSCFFLQFLSLEAVSATGNGGALTIGGVSNVNALNMTNVNARVSAFRKTTFCAQALYFSGAVRHVGDIILHQCSFNATCETDSVAAGVFASVVLNTSIQFSASTMVARGKKTTQAGSILGSATQLRQLLILDSTISAASESSMAQAAYFGAIVDSERFHVARSLIRSSAQTNAAYGLYTTAISSVRSIVIADSAVVAVAGAMGAYAGYTTSVVDADEFITVNTNATSRAGTSTAHSLGGSTLTNVPLLLVQNVTANATAGSKTGYAVSWSSTIRHVGSLLFVNVTAGAHTTASGASSMCLTGSMEHSGAVVLREVRAEAFGRTGSASVMELGKWTNMTSLLVQDSVLRATGEGGSLKALAFDSSVTGLGFVNVTDSTVEADSSMATTLASDSQALYMANKVADVGSFEVLRSRVRAIARTTSAYAFNFLQTQLRVGRVVAHQSTIEACALGGSTAQAVFLVAPTEVAAIEVVDTSVMAVSSSTASAVHIGTLVNVSRLAVVRSPILAYADGSMVYAVRTAAWTGGDSFIVRDSNVTARAGSTCHAVSTLAITGVSQLQIVNSSVSAYGVDAKVYALHMGTVTGSDGLLIENVTAVADSSKAGATHAVHVAGLSKMAAVTVKGTTAVATSLHDYANAVTFSGLVSELGVLLFTNVTASATARTYASSLFFAKAVSSVRHVVLEDVDARAKAFGTTPKHGHGAHSLMFHGSLSLIGTFAIRRAHLDAESSKTFSSFGASALHVNGATSHVTTIVIEDVTAHAYAKQSLASALRFTSLTNVSTLRIAHVQLTAKAGQDNAHALSCSALVTTQQLIISDSAATADARSAAYSLYLTSVATTDRLQIARCTVVATAAQTNSHAMFTGALVSVAVITVVDTAATATSIDAGSSNAAVFTSMIDVALARIHNLTASAMTKTTRAQTCDFGSLTNAHVTLDASTCKATSTASTATSAVHVSKLDGGSFQVASCTFDSSSAAAGLFVGYIDGAFANARLDIVGSTFRASGVDATAVLRLPSQLSDAERELIVRGQLQHINQRIRKQWRHWWQHRRFQQHQQHRQHQRPRHCKDFNQPIKQRRHWWQHRRFQQHQQHRQHQRPRHCKHFNQPIKQRRHWWQHRRFQQHQQHRQHQRPRHCKHFNQPIKQRRHWWQHRRFQQHQQHRQHQRPRHCKHFNQPIKQRRHWWQHRRFQQHQQHQRSRHCKHFNQPIKQRRHWWQHRRFQQHQQHQRSRHCKHFNQPIKQRRHWWQHRRFHQHQQHRQHQRPRHCKHFNQPIKQRRHWWQHRRFHQHQQHRQHQRPRHCKHFNQPIKQRRHWWQHRRFQQHQQHQRPRHCKHFNQPIKQRRHWWQHRRFQQHQQHRQHQRPRHCKHFNQPIKQRRHWWQHRRFQQLQQHRQHQRPRHCKHFNQPIKQRRHWWQHRRFQQHQQHRQHQRPRHCKHFNQPIKQRRHWWWRRGHHCDDNSGARIDHHPTWVSQHRRRRSDYPSSSSGSTFIVTLSGGWLVPPSWTRLGCNVVTATTIHCAVSSGTARVRVLVPAVLPAWSTATSVSASAQWGSSTPVVASASTGFPSGMSLDDVTVTSSTPALNGMTPGGTMAIRGNGFEFLPRHALVGPFPVTIGSGSGSATFTVPSIPFVAMAGETEGQLRTRIISASPSATARWYLDATLTNASVASILSVAKETTAGSSLSVSRFGIDVRNGEVVVHPRITAAGSAPLVPEIVSPGVVRAAGTAVLNPVSGTTTVPVLVSKGAGNGTCISLCSPGTTVTLKGVLTGSVSVTSVGIKDRETVRDVNTGAVLGEIICFVFPGVLPPEGGVGSGENTTAPVTVTIVDPVALTVLAATTRYVVADIITTVGNQADYGATLHLRPSSELVVENVTVILYTDLFATGASFPVYSESASCKHLSANFSISCSVATLADLWSAPLYIKGVPAFFWGTVFVRAHIHSGNAAWQEYLIRFTRGSTGPALVTPSPATSPGVGDSSTGGNGSTVGGPSPPGTPSPDQPGAPDASGPAVPLTVVPATELPAPLSVERRMAGVFSLSGACAGAPNVALLAVLIFVAVIAARAVVTVVQRRRVDPQAVETRNVDRRTALSRVHLLWALVWPEHHYAGVPHAVVAMTHVLSLLAAVAVLLHNYRQIAEDSSATVVLLALLAAVFGGAMQPLLTVLFRAYRIQDNRRDRFVPLMQSRAQDLQVFGVPRKRFIGVTDATFSGLDAIEFSKAALEGGAISDSAFEHSDAESRSAHTDSDRSASSAHRRTFNPRTCVTVDCRRYTIIAYVVNVVAAVVFFLIAYNFTASWCPASYPLFWTIVGVTLGCDLVAVQPMHIAMTVLYCWMTAEPEQEPTYDLIPIQAQWYYVGAACQNRVETDATHTRTNTPQGDSLSGTLRVRGFADRRQSLFEKRRQVEGEPSGPRSGSVSERSTSSLPFVPSPGLQICSSDGDIA